jgi:hypothetical protein
MSPRRPSQPRSEPTLKPPPSSSTRDSSRFPPRVLITGAIALIAAGASAWLIGRSPAIHCDALAPLTVLATLAAFLIAICFRQMSRFSNRSARWFLLICLLIAAATLFTDFRFVRRYRDYCNQLRQQIRQSTPAR